jgi:hypothetical protein
METPYLAQKPAIDAALGFYRLWQSLNQHFHEVLPLPMVQPRKHLTQPVGINDLIRRSSRSKKFDAH